MRKSKMTIAILGYRSTILITGLIMIALLVLPLACATIGQQRSLKKVKAKVEGTWILEEWQIKGQAVSPPKVEGRFIIHDNAIELILLNRAGEVPWSHYAYGKYTLDPSEFSLGLDEVSTFKELASGITVSHKPPWEGMKSYGVSIENNQLIMRCAEGGSSIVVDGDTLILKHKGKITRTYRRAGAK